MMADGTVVVGCSVAGLTGLIAASAESGNGGLALEAYGTFIAFDSGTLTAVFVAWETESTDVHESVVAKVTLVLGVTVAGRA
jgi:hypothetical protein